jgi:hypothetical protein
MRKFEKGRGKEHKSFSAELINKTRLEKLKGSTSVSDSLKDLTRMNESDVNE